MLALHPLPPASATGLRLHACETRLAIQPALAGLKHCNRLELVLARVEVERAGCDEVLMLEDLIADDGGTDPETEVDRHKIAMALHRAIADLAPVERRVLYRMYLEDATIAETADLFGLTETEVAEIAENAGATLRARLAEAGSVRDPSGRAPIQREIAHTQRLPQPIEDRRRVAAALTGEEAGSDT